MLALLKKEINSFFASPIGYLVMAIFLIINGLFLFLFKGTYNILDYGFADLSPFFLLAPWVLLFLIPAVTMRSFSDEKRQGTLELLLTKPISKLQIILGKYFGVVVLIILALIPTLLYVYTIHKLGNPIGNLDVGSTLGSYFGLLLLITAYSAIGVFASTLSKNQIVAFIIGVFICAIFFIGIEGIADFTSSATIEKFSMNYHFQNISRGVVDTRDILYFLSVTVFFIVLTALGIRTEKLTRKDILRSTIIFLTLLVFNILTQSFYGRFDLTQDKRYTLSDAAYNVIKEVNSPIIIDVFLEGEFPSNIRRLQSETRQLLEEFADKNHNIKYSFKNLLKNVDVRDQNLKLLSDSGMPPMMLTVQENGRTSQEPIIPWALATYNGQRIEIPLIKNKIGAAQDDLVQNSVQHLEYAFADGFSKLVSSKSKAVAVLKGNGQLEDKYVASFLTTLGDYYFIAPFTLDSVATSPQSTLKKLQEFDLIISTKPTVAFSEEEKLVLDQYIMNGGKSMWMIDNIAIEKDSLYNESGSNIAIARDLNLTDFFFKYGIRINPVLVNDLYSERITLAIGEGSDTQLTDLNWTYSPLASGNPEHAITKNLDLVRLDFANQIDTLKNSDISKTILLRSSPLSKLEGAPKLIELEKATQKPNPETYANNGNQTLAVLLEGKFTSVYHNRVKPLTLSENKNKSSATKMIIVADGDIIKNELERNRPLELGFNRRTGQLYGNKEFLLNAANYLLDDSGLINIRTKDVAIAHLNPERISKEKTKWQVINIALPLILLAGFGFAFNFFRKKKYAA